MAPFRRLSIPSRPGHSPGKAETLHLQSPRMLPGRLSTAPSPPGPCNSCKLQAAPVPVGGRAKVLQQKAGRRGPGGKPLSPCRWLPPSSSPAGKASDQPLSPSQVPGEPTPPGCLPREQPQLSVQTSVPGGFSKQVHGKQLCGKLKESNKTPS